MQSNIYYRRSDIAEQRIMELATQLGQLHQVPARYVDRLALIQRERSPEIRRLYQREATADLLEQIRDARLIRAAKNAVAALGLPTILVENLLIADLDQDMQSVLRAEAMADLLEAVASELENDHGARAINPQK